MKEFGVKDGVISRTPKIKPMSPAEKLDEVLRNTREILQRAGRSTPSHGAIWTVENIADKFADDKLTEKQLHRMLVQLEGGGNVWDTNLDGAIPVRIPTERIKKDEEVWEL